MSYRIEILENNVVEIFKDDSDKPFLRQPNWPDGTQWLDSIEARVWADMYVEAMEDANAPYVPLGPGQGRKAKPTAEQLEAINKIEDPNSTEEEKASAKAILDLM